MEIQQCSTNSWELCLASKRGNNAILWKPSVQIISSRRATTGLRLSKQDFYCTRCACPVSAAGLVLLQVNILSSEHGSSFSTLSIWYLTFSNLMLSLFCPPKSHCQFKNTCAWMNEVVAEASISPSSSFCLDLTFQKLWAGTDIHFWAAGGSSKDFGGTKSGVWILPLALTIGPWNSYLTHVSASSSGRWNIYRVVMNIFLSFNYIIKTMNERLGNWNWLPTLKKVLERRFSEMFNERCLKH